MTIKGKCKTGGSQWSVDNEHIFRVFNERAESVCVSHCSVSQSGDVVRITRLISIPEPTPETLANAGSLLYSGSRVVINIFLSVKVDASVCVVALRVGLVNNTCRGL